MPIKSIETEFEVTGFPQYVDVESKLYEINKINRLCENGTSTLLIIYREKSECHEIQK